METPPKDMILVAILEEGGNTLRLLEGKSNIERATAVDYRLLCDDCAQHHKVTRTYVRAVGIPIQCSNCQSVIHEI